MVPGRSRQGLGFKVLSLSTFRMRISGAGVGVEFEHYLGLRLYTPTGAVAAMTGLQLLNC